MAGSAQRLGSRVDELCGLLSREIRSALDGPQRWLPPERELAERYGVSRTVVREAVKRLELQGLLEVQHGVGLKVVDRLHAPLSGALELLLPDEADRLSQLMETRRTVEPEIARLAAERARLEDVAALRAVQDRLAAAAGASEAIQCDVDFHRALARAAGNRILELLLESLGDLGRESRKATIAQTGQALVFDHHARILAAVEARRPDDAREAMRHHLDHARDDLHRHFTLRKRAAKPEGR